MANGVNKVILIGNLGKDPEVIFTPAGLAICKISLATTESRKVNDQWQDETEWHKVTLFGHDANSVGDHCRKGSQIYVEGKVRYDSYEKDGIKRHTTEVIVRKLQRLSKSMSDQQPVQPQQSEKVFDPETDNDGNGTFKDLPF